MENQQLKRRVTRFSKRPVGRKAGFLFDGEEIGYDDIRIKRAFAYNLNLSNEFVIETPKQLERSSSSFATDRTKKQPKLTKKKTNQKKKKKNTMAEDEAVEKELKRLNGEFDEVDDFQLLTEEAPRDFYVIKKRRRRSQQQQINDLLVPESSLFFSKQNSTQFSQPPQNSSLNLSEEIVPESPILNSTISTSSQQRPEQTTVHSTKSPSLAPESLSDEIVPESPAASYSQQKLEETTKETTIHSNTPLPPPKILSLNVSEEIVPESPLFSSKQNLIQSSSNNTLLQSQNSSEGIVLESLILNSNIFTSSTQQEETPFHSSNIQLAPPPENLSEEIVLGSSLFSSKQNSAQFSSNKTSLPPTKKSPIASSSQQRLEETTKETNVPQHQSLSLNLLEENVSESPILNSTQQLFSTQLQASTAKSFSLNVSQQKSPTKEKSSSRQKSSTKLSSIPIPFSPEVSPILETPNEQITPSSTALSPFQRRPKISSLNLSPINLEDDEEENISPINLEDDEEENISPINLEDDEEKNISPINLEDEENISNLIQSPASTAKSFSLQQKSSSLSFQNLSPKNLEDEEENIQLENTLNKNISEKSPSLDEITLKTIPEVFDLNSTSFSSLATAQSFSPLQNSNYLINQKCPKISSFNLSLKNLEEEEEENISHLVQLQASTAKNFSLNVPKQKSPIKEKSSSRQKSSNKLSSVTIPFSPEASQLQQTILETSSRRSNESIQQRSLSTAKSLSPVISDEEEDIQIENTPPSYNEEENLNKNDFTIFSTPRVAPISPSRRPKEFHNILDYCDNNYILTWDEFFTVTNFKCLKKLGEGDYGEVFEVSSSERNYALKVIPITPENSVENIYSEVLITHSVSKLNVGESFTSPSFIPLVRSNVVEGSYPETLLTVWDNYKKANEGKSGVAENERPNLDDHNIYVLLIMENGGTDLEAFLTGEVQESQRFSIFYQVAISLAIAEERCEFEHRDLHYGNILISKCTSRDKKEEKEISFLYNDETIKIRSHGAHVSIIDFTNSRMTDNSGESAYIKLKDVFESHGDYQFDIYRMMKKENGDDWVSFNRKTNNFWLHYLSRKLFDGKKYNNEEVDVFSSSERSALFSVFNRLVKGTKKKKAFERIIDLLKSEEFKKIFDKHIF
ncbi:hypothetical protein ACQ4LE_007710 [Meloidogyne hapla]|uniref:non-specific serine/threonine protein kinase n=1 Tax=Meloidogyne hapla TaxID=6305 RepID=A0A1I8BL74_MELHA